MSERELLELAAKAAGIVIDKSPYNGGGFGNTGFDSMGNAVLDWHNGVKWNPRDDDGDCARLEAACSINIEWQRIGVVAYVQDGPRVREAYADHPNKDAARRYSSTRAAAEIGESMP